MVIVSATNYRDRNFRIVWTDWIERSALTINRVSSGNNYIVLLQQLKSHVSNVQTSGIWKLAD